MKFAVMFIFMAAPTLFALDTGIRDNSFLIEEGYNQERGVVQHILVHRTDWQVDGPNDAVIDFEFTQEWPLWGQKVQGSYTVPIETQFEGANAHLRYQLSSEPQDGYSVAPRLSFLLHYDSDLDLKNMLGYQINIPISKELDRKRMIHANLGATFEPPPPGYTLYWEEGMWVYNLGVSGIYALRPNLHAMAELLSFTSEGQEPSYIANPGARYAVNQASGAQWVFGASAPISFQQDIDGYGFLLYLSFEHRFLK